LKTTPSSAFDNAAAPSVEHASDLIMPAVTICVLTYGDYPRLAQRAIDSIRRHCSRYQYRLIVGANAAGDRTLKYLDSLQTNGDIDHLILSQINLNQCPMMRRMFPLAQSEFIWWFDDDSYITEPHALDRWLEPARRAPERTVMWGPLSLCAHPLSFAPDQDNVAAFVRGADWYRGLPPPSWRTGGKGEFNFQGNGTGDGRWFFIPGGCWLMRTSAIRDLDWPDRRLIKMGNDVLLGEAIRQQGWELEDIGSSGVAINTEERRGDPGWYSPPGLSRDAPA
jgi:glycosyltransferase involved in cell wall biosynthesis